ncbi:MAG: YihY/virulence factor BrkB family protein [Erysipelotrichia bacterium]|nr:YihY/virulence factor BrkB family protein [Erysipelotrichia bacterium]
MNKIIAFLFENKKQIDKTVNDQVGLYSTEAAFYAIISAVPFLMFLLSMLKYVIPIDFAQLEHLLNSALPKAVSYWLERIISSIYTDATISLTSISAITCVWAASKSVFSLSKGFRKIYSTEDKTNIVFVRVYSLILTVILAVSIALALLLLVFSQQLVDLLQKTPLHTLAVVLTSPLISTLLFIIVTTLLFAAMYKLLSFTKINYKNHLPGAFAASVSWLLFSKIYSIYINSFSNFSITYGSLAAIVLLMVWLKFCMMILLYGAELNLAIISKNKQA